MTHPLGSAAEAGEFPSDTEKASAQQARVPNELASDPAVSEGAGSRVGQRTSPPRPRWRLAAWWALALLLLCSLLLPLLKTGLWDPHELETADLARRTAINLFGARELALEGADNSIPSVEDVGRGELPLLTLALSLKLFGAHTWALRLPLLALALLGLLALYAVCVRLGSRRLAVFSVLVLATSPLYFVHARTALGEIVTMASLSVAFAGAMLAVFDRALAPWQRWGAWGVALLFSAAAMASRGVLIGSIALLSVGLVWLLFALHAESTQPRDRCGAWAGALTLLLGGAAAAWGGWALWVASSERYLRAMGSAVKFDKQFPTHDFVVHALGHGLLPWSALIPVALGFALRDARGPRATAELPLRLGFVLASVVAVTLHTLLAARAGVVPFAAPFALAGVAAVGALELDRRAQGSALLVLATTALLVLFLGDFQNFPEKAFSAFGVAKATFPVDFKSVARRWVQISVGIALLGCLLSMLRHVYLSGRLSQLVEQLAARPQLRVAGLLRFIHGRLIQNKISSALGQALDRRGAVLVGALCLSGLTLSLGYYPALGAELSPVGAFASYKKLVKEGEPLAVMGSRPGAAFFAADTDEVFTSPQQASDWLLQNETQRRWLISQSKDLAALNARFRSQVSKPVRNLPVLDARSSQALLLSNQLLEGEHSSNPLDRFLPDARPVLAKTLDVVLDDKLAVLGYEIRRKRDQRPVDKLEAGDPLVFVIAYEVLGRISGTWQTFIHIDGDGKRFNGDHEPLEGQYPFRHWQPGDFVLDLYEFELEPSFTPGKYEVFFGMFSGERRLPVTRGEHHENRIKGGQVQVVEL